MRTAGGLQARMLERENLLRAVHLAARGRRDRPAVRAYLERLDEELADLREELASGDLRCGECTTFTVYDPKERRITAPVFRERVLHHAVMAVCGPVLDRRLIHHSYACRAGKGTHAALAAARSGAAAGEWFLKLDVRKYFERIPHAPLRVALARVFREEPVRRMLGTLISAYAEAGAERGLPIGTLASQHLANFYLAALDTRVVQELRPVAYVRYMDDLALWFGDRERARAARDDLSRYAAEALGLEFKTGFINRSARGMDFLGHRVFPRRLGLARSGRRRYRTRVRAVQADWREGRGEEADAQAKAVALGAAVARAGCLEWRRRVLTIWGDEPQGATACCAAAAGSITATMPGPPTATATRPATATTTLVSGPPPAPAAGRMARVEPARLPAPPGPGSDETRSPRRRSVTPDADAPVAKADGGGVFLQRSPFPSPP